MAELCIGQRTRRANPTALLGRFPCSDGPTYQVVDRMVPALQRRQRPACQAHARILQDQGWWIFPPGDDEAESIRL